MGNQNPTRKARWRWFASAVLLIVFAFGVLHLRNRPIPPSPTSPLIGSWTTANPQGPGTTRTLTLMSDGALASTDVADESGKILQHAVSRWRVEGKTLVFREHRQGLASLLDDIPRMELEEDRIAILSVSDNELLAGSPAAPIVYTRASD